MKLNVPFGDTTIDAELPDSTFIVPSAPKKQIPAVDDLETAVRDALENPLGLPPLKDLVKTGSRVVIAFDDGTVPSFTPVRAVAIRQVLEKLEEAGVDRDSVQLICANALHRKFRHEEMATWLGEDLVEEFGDRLFCHDAEDKDNLVYLGQTESGHDVEISRYVMESDLTVYVNGSHNRGFNGGWKSVCVGLSTWRSIRHHHTPDGMSMSVKNNRMHAMLDEMGAFLESKMNGTIFKIDTLEANVFEVGKVVAGSVAETRKAIMDVVSGMHGARRDLSDSKYDVIVYGVPNWSPYSAFSFMNPTLTLISSGLGYLGGTIEALGNPGCTVIMATPCPDQWDEVHHAPYPKVWNEVLTKTLNPYEIERDYSDAYANDSVLIDKYRNHHSFHPIHGILATHPLKRLKHAGKVIVAGIEDKATAEHVGFAAAESVEDALDQAASIHGSDFTVAYAQNPASPTKVNM